MEASKTHFGFTALWALENKTFLRFSDGEIGHSSKNSDISCKNGNLLHTGDFCEQQGQCPISYWSPAAMKSNCTKSSNHFCPVGGQSTKICMEKFNVSMIDYCSAITSDYPGYMCPSLGNGLIFEQCYNE